MRWRGQEWHSLVDPRESCLWCNWTPREIRQINRSGLWKNKLYHLFCILNWLYLTRDRTCSLFLRHISPRFLTILCVCKWSDHFVTSDPFTSVSYFSFLPFVLTADKYHMWQHLDWPLVTSLIPYLKSGPPQLHDMSSKLKLWLERSMITSMALDLSRAIWSSAVSSLKESNSLQSVIIDL